MNTQQRKQNYTFPIIMMFCLFFMISFVTGLQNPMGVIVKNQFGASNFLSQLGNFANFIAYAFMGIPAGILLKRKGYKFTSLAAVLVGFIGVGIILVSSFLSNLMSDNGIFGIYIAGAFVSGFSMCMLNTVVNPMLNTLGGGGNKGNQLIQWGGSVNSIGATIVPVLGGYLIGDVAQAHIGDARPALYLAMSIFALAFIVLSFVKMPEPHLISKGQAKVKDTHSHFSFRHYLLGVASIFLYVGLEVGIPNIANLLMTQPAAVGGLAIDATIAGSVVGTYWFLMLIGRLFGASLSAKVSSRAMLSFVSVVAILLVAVAIYSPFTTAVSMPVFKANISFGLVKVPLSIMFLVLCGLCTSVMWGSIFNLAVEGLGKYTAAASGFFMVMACGGGILPLLQGFIADKTDYMSSYWVILAALLFLLYYALFGSRNVNKDIVTE